MNRFEFTGKIIWVGKKAEGVSASTGKQWASLQVVITEEDAQYPQKVCATIFGEDKIASMMPVVGETVTAHLSLDARSYTDKNGVTRGSTEVRIWKLEREGENNAPAPTNNQFAGNTQQKQSAPAQQEPSDDGLPF